METWTFSVEDITCGGCANSIQKGLSKDTKISSVEVDVANKLAKVSGDLSAEEVKKKIEALGFTPRLV